MCIITGTYDLYSCFVLLHVCLIFFKYVDTLQDLLSEMKRSRVRYVNLPVHVMKKCITD